MAFLSTVRASFAAALLLSSAASTSAQAPPPAPQAPAPTPPTSAQAPSPPTQPPVFKSGTDVIAIDVSVIGGKGDVVSGLGAGDFTVEVDGKPRHVTSAQWIGEDAATSTAAAAATPAHGSFASNETAAGGRLVLLAFDLDGIKTGGGRDVATAAGKFVDGLAASDQVGLVSLPSGPSVEFTPDRTPIHDALSHIVGQGTHVAPHIHSVGLSEAYDISNGNTFALRRAVERECVGTSPQSSRPNGPVQAASPCPREVEQEAREIAQLYQQRSQTTMRGVESLLVSLSSIDAPKIIVFVSSGVPVAFGDTDTAALARYAAAAHATIYVLHLDGGTFAIDASTSQRSPSAVEDRGINLHGLESIAGSTRGAVFSSIGDGANAFDRIAREMAAYYLLSVESDPADRDGHRHKIKVSLGRPGLTVRARREFVAGGAAEAATTPEEQVHRVLQAPLMATGLPLRVATYNLRAPQPDKVRVLLAADIGRAEPAALTASLGYSVLSPQGKPLASAFQSATAELMDKSTPGAAHTTVAIDLPPGKYRLKLAVVDKGGRKGSVEHAFEASITGSGGLEAGDLLLTPPITDVNPSVRLTAAPAVDGAALDAYVEIYGPAAPGLAVHVEVADTETSPALATADAPVSEGRDKSRLVSEGPLPLGLLPPGWYVARARITNGTSTITRSRQFELAHGVPADDVFKQDMAKRVGAFVPDAVLSAGLLHAAVESAVALDNKQSAPAARALAAEVSAGRLEGLADVKALSGDTSLLASFLRGLSLYKAGKIEDAALQFRAAIKSSPDFLSGVFYLGACYAAGGKTKQAVGAWQAALTGDDLQPDMYQLAADAFLRLGDADEAAGLLQEAGARWPDDPRFALTAALARAANGHLDEALAGIQPLVDRPTPDPDAMSLAIQIRMAQLATTPDAADPATQLRSLVSQMQNARTAVPPMAERWLKYLADKPPAH